MKALIIFFSLITSAIASSHTIIPLMTEERVYTKPRLVERKLWIQGRGELLHAEYSPHAAITTYYDDANRHIHTETHYKKGKLARDYGPVYKEYDKAGKVTYCEWFLKEKYMGRKSSFLLNGKIYWWFEVVKDCPEELVQDIEKYYTDD